ncbi:DUF1311 domain-containing protein [Clostridium sp. 19966]|uniref:lysozyme inhibitor LprI family protein n=1 Tax=Clostridium sp. 19966 TaxID=2768166 RepID=UPI0028DF72DB|nr:lysozyme inhibitor LprI family protein [Clostridium sp. 19966]MDT8715341.1 DUF1311 domain-containing protein [Clostridium sp. 19966]
MNGKILSILMVLILGISVTACSNKNSGSNSDNKSINTDAKVASVDDNKNSKTQLLADDNTNQAIEAYKAVLENKAEFYSSDNKKDVYLKDFLTNGEIYETTFKLKHFAVLDLDGDGRPEVVLELTTGDFVEFYEVLHYNGKKVNGYIQVLRGFANLKADGSVGFSNSAFNNGYGKISFENDVSKLQILGYKDSVQKGDDLTHTYYIDNKAVTEEAYNNFTKAQDNKKDAVWYDFNTDNIEIKITDIKSSTESNDVNQKTKKQEYKDKLDKIQAGFKSSDNKSASTNDMYQQACEEYKQWDDELNAIYGILKGQLSSSDMKNLQTEELGWIKDRDAKAKKASAEMAGGTMEKVLYEGSLADSTKERCYELVDKYMK